MKILVAMSGGVDSSTVCHLLKEQGHELIGVRFTLWTDPLAPAIEQILPSKCCNAQTAARCAQTAKDLDIPLHIIDLQDAFKEEVVDPFLEDHKKGLTPNPCIRCNRTIKFGKLIAFMKEMGCEKLATGHYARIAEESLSDGTSRQILLEAIDRQKDQSYYLYGLNQEQLQHVLFPLGGMEKQEVMALAKHYNVPLPTAYQESQDLCFFPEKTPQAFLKRHLKDAIQQGSIVRKNGTVVGTHSGLPLYTIGQRKGLGIGGLKVPLEVVGKDTKTNELIVDDQGKQKADSVQLHTIRWISWSPKERQKIEFTCRTHSLSPKVHGTLEFNGSEGIFHFDNPVPLQASGQSLVLYRGEEVVGGGVMQG